MAEDLLSKYEVQLGLKSPETARWRRRRKNLGPAVTENKTETEDRGRQPDTLGTSADGSTAAGSWLTRIPHRTMSNGKPKPAFLPGDASRRRGAALLRRVRASAAGACSEPAATSISPTRSRKHERARSSRREQPNDGQGIHLRRGAKLPEVKGTSAYAPMANNTVRMALNVWAGWAPVISRQQRLQGRQGLEGAGRQDVQARARADRRPDRDARRIRVGQGPHRLGDARHGSALRRAAAEGFAHDAAHLPADRLVERRRRHRLSRNDQVRRRSARQDGSARAELAVALLPAQHAHLGRAAAERSAIQVHAGRLSGRRRIQRRQDRVVRRDLGARHLQPGRSERATACS